MADTRELSKRRKRRGISRASITRLEKRICDLEATANHPTTIERAKQIAEKLKTIDDEFNSFHREVIDLIDETDTEALENEQETLDEHEDLVAEMSIRLKRLCTDAAPTDLKRISSRKLAHLEQVITAIRDAITALPADHDDMSLIEQYETQLSGYKMELSALHTELLSVEDEDQVKDQLTACSKIEDVLFECFLKGRKLKSNASSETSSSVQTEKDRCGVKLPKLEVPKFDGNILHWKRFWEQFCVSVHQRSNLSNAEKLVYLQRALEDGNARSVIEGLSQSGEQYAEAVKCLTSRFDRPRLIHQAHVKMILDVPPVRNGTGQELRELHDTIQQHTRALKSMEQEPSPSFITSVIELKLDSNTMFEWQRHTHSQNDVPHYCDMLEFLDSRAQASEVSILPKKPFKNSVQTKRLSPHTKSVSSLPANCDISGSQCPSCKTEKHPLYSCPKFRSLPHDQKLTTVKVNKMCMNCLGKGHFVPDCKSAHRCRKCQKPHHTQLHVDHKDLRADQSHQPMATVSETGVSANMAATKLEPCSLLMTCQVQILASDGSSVKTRALLDSGSSASFISEKLVQSLRLNRTKQRVSVSGIGGISPPQPIHSVTSFKIVPIGIRANAINITALVVPCVISDLPVSPVPFDPKWTHLSDLRFADPEFGIPGRVEILLGVDVFTDVLLHGRRKGPPGSPAAMETLFGWVLCGNTESTTSTTTSVTVCHASVNTGDDLIRRFWEIEEPPSNSNHLSMEERAVVQHFKSNHSRKCNGRFVVPLPKRPDATTLGESRSQAVRRFLSLERSLNSKNRFKDIDEVVQEYFTLQHAEAVPPFDLGKPTSEVFYLPIHAVYKQSSTTTKVRAVFDASAKSSSGKSLNDLLLVGPTIHPPLIDVLLRFRTYRIAITADVSKMYRAVELAGDDKDLHRFVWRSSPDQLLRDYRMTRLTFGVSASSFAANMAVKQNALDLVHEYPSAAQVVEECFYVDDCLTGSNTIEGAINLHLKLVELFDRGGFLLRKWNSSDTTVLQSINPNLRDSLEVLTISGSGEYTKALGLEWNTTFDHFRLTIPDSPLPDTITKRILVSQIAKIFDVLGWFSPVLIKMKILLQRLWEEKVDWDDPIPSSIHDSWLHLRSKLSLLSNYHLPRYYFPKNVNIINTQLHGFCDASEDAYGGVVYIRGEDADGNVHVALVLAKTKVAPLKRLTIPRLELCGAYLLSQLLDHTKNIYRLPISSVHAWTDSTIVLNWLNGSPKRFKTFVGNRISSITNRIPPNRWNHVSGNENPADCASRGLNPEELLDHELWWKGPDWLTVPMSQWPKSPPPPSRNGDDEEREVCSVTICQPSEPIIPLEHYDKFSKFQRVTAWVFRFINNCQPVSYPNNQCSHLSVDELSRAERYWIKISQYDSFSRELAILASSNTTKLPKNSSLKVFNPFLDSYGLMRVGGRLSNTKFPYSKMHPIILHGKHIITKRIIYAEHIRMLHAGPTLLSSSITSRFHIINLRNTVRSITHNCVICKRFSGKTLSQQQGQLPPERVTPGQIFEDVGVDYAGPFNIKYGYVRKPVIVKAYVCVFVSLTVKAVHLELVSDLTSEAFIATLRRFVCRRGLPRCIWSDHGTNFTGANHELKEFFQFLQENNNQTHICEFCTSKGIDWKFIPERSPHFGGLWEAAVKSMKFHLRRITRDIKMTFEEMSTTLCQIEACLNSRPLVPLNTVDENVIEVLTPGHFIAGKSLTALPDRSATERPLTELKRWQLCQNVVNHFWKRWSVEYITSLNKYTKWTDQKDNISIGDIVILRDEVLFPTYWPLARVINVHPGKDNLIRVVTLKTSKGIYKRPVTKIVVLVPTRSPV